MTREQKSTGSFLQELPGKTIFEGRVAEIKHKWGVDYNVQNGGWNGEEPDTWLTEHVLRRFAGKHVRVTVEEVPAPD